MVHGRYVGERCSHDDADERVAAEPMTDIYMMELGGGVHACCIDALSARNASAYANFGCTNARCNMEKRATVAHHWDARMPHAAFYATRDITPGEPLIYRRDEAVTSSARAFSGDPRRRDAAAIRCQCGHADCMGWV